MSLRDLLAAPIAMDAFEPRVPDASGPFSPFIPWITQEQADDLKAVGSLVGVAGAFQIEVEDWHKTFFQPVIDAGIRALADEAPDEPEP